MEQITLARIAKEISKMHFHPWHLRDKDILKQRLAERDPEFYSYVINDWIPEQPDFQVLMKLFILLNFDLKLFFQFLVQPPPGKKPRPKVA